MVEQEEREILGEYAIGEGIDVGCGKNKIGNFGVDKDPTTSPDIVCEMWNIPLPGNTQDYIIGCHSLEHTVHTIRTLKEWHRLLRENGTIAIAVPNGEEVNTKNLGDSLYGHVQLFSKKTIQNFLEFVGFKIMDIIPFEKQNSASHIGSSIIVIAQK